MTTNEEIAALRRKREKLTKQTLLVFPKKPAEPRCYKCTKEFKIGDKLTWHWTGFLYHVGCEPKD